MTLFIRTTLCLSFLLVLSSCGASQGLPASAVLRNAALESQKLDSARYTLHAEVHEKSSREPWNITADIVGVLRSGGRVIQGEATFDADIAASLMTVGVSGRGTFFLEWDKEGFIILDTLSTQPAGVAPAFSDLLHQWWNIPLSERTTGDAISPDPVLLRSQAEIVTVTKEHGIVNMGGREAYHYDVALDAVALRAYLRAHAEQTGGAFDDAEVDTFLSGYTVSGKLWIDAKNFHMLRVVWDIRKAEHSIMLDMNFSDHNAAPVISFPTESKPLPLSTMLQRIMGISTPQF